LAPVTTIEYAWATIAKEQQENTPVAFAIVKEGVPCLWVGGFQIFAPSFAETLLSAVLSEFIFRILAKFQLAGPESGSV
jgi:hypothetical protein